MSYIDGFVLAVPTANKAAYTRLAEDMAVVFKDHGALSVVECWGDDVPEGKVNSMHTAVMRKPDEAMVMSWIVWPDKATRDAGLQASMTDPRAQTSMQNMPFDGSRMIMGGFDAIVET